MNRLILILFLVFPSANAADLAAAQEALKVISEFADEFCRTPPLEGGTQGVDLSMSAKAELSEVLRKVANLGVEGAAKYQSAQYQGLLQKDLAVLLRDSSNCRLEVWRDLKDKLLPPIPPAPAPGSGAAPSPQPSAEQVALIERAKRAEEENRRLEEASRLARAQAEAEAAFRDFSIRNYPIVLDPTPNQVRTLAVLFREKARAEEIDAYLELMEARVGLVLIERPGALRRMRSILDAAAQVAAGSNVGSSIEGATRKERVRSFAELFMGAAPIDGDEGVQAFRQQVLRYPSLSLN